MCKDTHLLAATASCTAEGKKTAPGTLQPATRCYPEILPWVTDIHNLARCPAYEGHAPMS